jgi:hypothetical protein
VKGCGVISEHFVVDVFFWKMCHCRRTHDPSHGGTMIYSYFQNNVPFPPPDNFISIGKNS